MNHYFFNCQRYALQTDKQWSSQATYQGARKLVETGFCDREHNNWDETNLKMFPSLNGWASKNKRLHIVTKILYTWDTLKVGIIIGVVKQTGVIIRNKPTRLSLTDELHDFPRCRCVENAVTLQTIGATPRGHDEQP